MTSRIFKLTFVLSLLVLASFSLWASNARPTQGVTAVPQISTVCDHNNDGSHDLSDVTLFSYCKETFDADNDGSHDLTDVVLYAQNYQDTEWCLEMLPECSPAAYEDQSILGVPAESMVCDHNHDGSRDLSDLALFSQCKENLDVDGQNGHNLTDTVLYAQNWDDDEWCSTYASQCDGEPGQQAFSGAGNSNPADASNINAEVSCDEVNITWNTTQDSLTWIVYGETTAYGDEYKSEDYNSSHSFSLYGLPYGTTYNYLVKTENLLGVTKDDYNLNFTTPLADQCGVVLGEKVTDNGSQSDEGSGDDSANTCSYSTPDPDVLGKTDWPDGSLLRGCGPEVYRIENQTKRHITSLEELFNYIGQRIYNVTDDILALF